MNPLPCAHVASNAGDGISPASKPDDPFLALQKMWQSMDGTRRVLVARESRGCPRAVEARRRVAPITVASEPNDAIHPTDFRWISSTAALLLIVMHLSILEP